MIIRRSILLLVFLVLATAPARAGAGDYIADLNLYASKHFGDFKAELSARYGISGSRFDLMLKKLDSPGDLAVALWLGEKAYQSIDAVVKQYRVHRGKGWGVVAREIGIKPGSPSFQKLKNGDLGWYPSGFAEFMKKEKKQKALERKKKKRKQSKGG